MFRQPRNAKRASRACKVGQLGLEQLDARVVPSATTLVAPLAAGPAALSSPSDHSKSINFVAFDENTNTNKNADFVKWRDLSKDAKDALKVNGIKQDGVYELKHSIDLGKGPKQQEGDLWVAIYEQKKPHPGKDDSSFGHKDNKKLSDVLHIVTVKEKVDEGHGRDKFGQPKFVINTYVSVFSDNDDRDKSSGHDYGNKHKVDFDTGVEKFEKLPPGFFDIKADEQGKNDDNNFAIFTVQEQGKKGGDVNFFYFQSDGKLPSKNGPY